MVYRNGHVIQWNVVEVKHKHKARVQAVAEGTIGIPF